MKVSWLNFLSNWPILLVFAHFAIFAIFYLFCPFFSPVWHMFASFFQFFVCFCALLTHICWEAVELKKGQDEAVEKIIYVGRQSPGAAAITVKSHLPDKVHC